MKDKMKSMWVDYVGCRSYILTVFSCEIGRYHILLGDRYLKLARLRTPGSYRYTAYTLGTTFEKIIYTDFLFV